MRIDILCYLEFIKEGRMSGIYIQNMEMPKCHFKTGESHNVHGFWMVYPNGTSKLRTMVDRDHWVCDAISVPNHGRCIDSDALWVEINKICDRRDAGIISDLICINQLLSAIRHASTIIPADHADKEAGE